MGKSVLILLFYLIFISAMALLHTGIYNSIVKKWKIRPSWSLIAVYSGIGIILFFIDQSYPLWWLAFLFGIVALFFGVILFGVILGVIFGLVKTLFTGIKNIITGKSQELVLTKTHSILEKVPKLKKKKLLTETKDMITGKNKEPAYKKIRNILFMVLFVVLFFSTGPLFIVVIVVSAFVIQLMTFLIKGGGNFWKMQANLPTSKIRSMSMGLVEVEGLVQVIDALTSPIQAKECIAYEYRIEKITRDDEGKERFTTIHSEKKCNRFLIEDETGSVEVDSEKLKFEMFPIDEQYRSGSKRYTQYILQNDDWVLLVGKASLENDKPLIVYEDIKKVFGIAPAGTVTNWNRFKPLRSTILLYLTIFASMVALILAMPMEEMGGRIVIRLTSDIFRNLI